MNQESRSISVELCGGITHESVVFLKVSPEKGLFLKELPVSGSLGLPEHSVTAGFLWRKQSSRSRPKS